MYCISILILLSISAMATEPSLSPQEIELIRHRIEEKQRDAWRQSSENRDRDSVPNKAQQFNNYNERPQAEETSNEPTPASAANLSNIFLTKLLPNFSKPQTCSTYHGPEYDDDPLNLNGGNSSNDAPATYTKPKFEGIVSRQEAGLPPSKARNDTKEKTKITIHHSEGSKEQSVKDIYDFHTGPERNWGDIAYHFIISKSGGTWKVYEGRPLEKLGSHAKGNNEGNIGIMITGDYREKSSASNPSSPSSVESEAISLLEGLVEKIMQTHKIDGIHAHGKKHAGDMGILEGYDCPGAGLVEAVANLKRKYGV